MSTEYSIALSKGITLDTFNDLGNHLEAHGPVHVIKREPINTIAFAWTPPDYHSERPEDITISLDNNCLYAIFHTGSTVMIEETFALFDSFFRERGMTHEIDEL